MRSLLVDCLSKDMQQRKSAGELLPFLAGDVVAQRKGDFSTLARTVEESFKRIKWLKELEDEEAKAKEAKQPLKQEQKQEQKQPLKQEQILQQPQQQQQHQHYQQQQEQQQQGMACSRSPRPHRRRAAPSLRARERDARQQHIGGAPT
jgi:hypothetical protein